MVRHAKENSRTDQASVIIRESESGISGMENALHSGDKRYTHCCTLHAGPNNGVNKDQLPGTDKNSAMEPVQYGVRW